MDPARHFLFLRQQEDGAEPDARETQDCEADPADTTNIGLRIASVFVILVAGTLGAVLPLLLHRHAGRNHHIAKHLFFVFKFIGTGVIIGTAFMHLLVPALENLENECVRLKYNMTEYPWAVAIAGITVMLMFLVELFVEKYGGGHSHGIDSPSDNHPPLRGGARQKGASLANRGAALEKRDDTSDSAVPGAAHRDIEANPQSYSASGRSRALDSTESTYERDSSECPSHTAFPGQLTAIFILEFGIVFHSIFIGLALGTTDQLVILLIVLVFHQLFEGLGLGARLALGDWPRSKRWLPYVLAIAFGLSTPVATAAAIAAKPSTKASQQFFNGLFDAISAGILLYTGIFELLGREFMFNPHMRAEKFSKLLLAYGCVALGFSVMTTLAKWA